MAISGVVFASRSETHSVKRSLQRLAFDKTQSTVTLFDGLQTFGAINSHAALWHSGTCYVAFTGVLYDASTLLSLADLQLPNSGLKDPGDDSDAPLAARLIVALYERHGVEFPRYLDGSFSFALYDSCLGRLLLGKDAMAQQTLYYAKSNAAVYFSSELDGLQDWPGLESGLDEEALALNFTLQADVCRTMFRNIRTLPGGHVLAVEKDKPERLIRYWSPLNQPQLRLRDSRDYAQGLLAAMERAVARRLPNDGHVGSMLSSGFDSAGVTALAARELARQNRPLTAYTSAPVHGTAVGLRGGRFADEWPLASEVAKLYPNVEHVRIPTNGADWFEALDHISDTWGAPSKFLRNVRWFYAIWKHAEERGIGTLLEGSTGNLSVSYDGSFGLYDLRQRREWSLLAKAVQRRDAAGQGWKKLLMQLWMPENARLNLIRALQRRPQARFLKDTLLRPEFYASTGVPAPVYSLAGQAAKSDRTNGASWRFSILQTFDLGMASAAYRRSFGIVRADPTADRRLVEFCLSIPDEAFAPGGVPRQLYRDAMRDLLPPSLLNQPKRGMQASDFVETFDEYVPSFRQEVERIAASPLASRVLDVERMRAMLDRWPAEFRANPVEADKRYDFTFGGALAMGRFLRRLEVNQQN